MKIFRRASPVPLWRDEFPVRTADERYVTRRQFSRFLVLTSLGMFVGNLWILVRARNRLECPCHEGYFAVEDGRVLQGPPPRPLPRVLLERQGADLVAVGMRLGPGH
jgi:hypothetical protein